MAQAGRASLNDTIVAFLRERPEGVLSREVAERFLKIKNPGLAMAEAAIAGVLGADSRCSRDAEGKWHASSPAPLPGSESLRSQPWAMVFTLTDPAGERLLYVAVWTAAPECKCIVSGWCVDPHSLAFDEQEQLRSGADRPFSREAVTTLLRAVVYECEKLIPVFLSSSSRDLLISTCAAAGEVFTDDTVLVRELLKVMTSDGTSCPRPLTLPALEKSVLGAEQNGTAASKQAERFAIAVAETLELASRRGIESREEIDKRIQKDRAPLFAGKEFTYDDLLALPARPGVYGFKDKSGAYLYIGKATNLKRRLLSYFGDTDESPQKLERIRSQVTSLVTHPCGSELESLIHEFRLIRKYAPPLNRKTGIFERKGEFRPIHDCIVLLPHVNAGKGMSVWFREQQKILLKSFDTVFDKPDTKLIEELSAFFFKPKLPADFSDFPEQEIAVRWIKQHADSLAVVPVNRLAGAEEVYDALASAWRDLQGSSPAS